MTNRCLVTCSTSLRSPRDSVADAVMQRLLAAVLLLAVSACSVTSLPTARSQQIAHVAGQIAPLALDRQLLLAVAAYRVAPTHDAKASLLEALNHSPRLQRMLWALPGTSRVAYSPDGKRLAAGSIDGHVAVFDATSGAVLIPRTDTGSGDIWQLAFSPDGKRLLTRGEDAKVKFWEVGATLTLADSIDLNGDQSAMLALSGDWKRVAVMGDAAQQRVDVQDFPSRRLVSQIVLPQAYSNVSLSPSGDRMVSIGEGVVTLWDLTATPPRATQLNAQPHSGYEGAQFSPDGAIVAAAKWSDIEFWDARSGERLHDRTIRASGGVSAFAFSPESEQIALGTLWGQVEVYSLKDGHTLGPALGNQHDRIDHIAFAPRGGQIASARAGDPIMIWAPEAHSPLVQHRLTDVQQDFQIQYAGDALIGADVTKGLQIWNGTGDFAPVRRFTVKPFHFRVAAVSGDGRLIATAGSENLVYLLDARTGQVVHEFGTHQSDWVGALALSADGNLLAASGSNGEIELWSVAQPDAAPRRLPGHHAAVRVLKFSPDGRLLASAGDDNVVRLWTTLSGQPAGELKGHFRPVLALAFSPDSNTLASGGEDQQLRTWDIPTRQPLGPPRLAHHDDIRALAYSRDGRTLYSSGADTLLLAWEQGERVPLPLRPSRLGNYPYGVPHSDALSPSPDGRDLATADGEVRIWRIRAEDWADMACAIANRNLSRQEWTQFMPTSLPYQPVCPVLPPSQTNRP